MEAEERVHLTTMSDPFNLGSVGSVSVVEQDKVRAYVCMCIEKGEKQFNVMDEKGTRLFTAVEDKDICCQRCGCCCTRDFDIWLRKESEDGDNVYAYHVNRTCCTWFTCLQCCRRHMDVSDKAKAKIGSVGADYQVCSCWPSFTVKDQQDSDRFRVSQDTHFCAQCLCCGARSRQCCGIDCYIPASLTVKPLPSGKGTELEHMAGGRGNDADAYSLVFPEGASVNDKVLLVACTICVDYKMYTAPSQEKMKDAAPRDPNAPAKQG
jgi:hypothetical protein